MHDITIIGAGVSGIFAAHTLLQGNLRVLMIDKGKRLEERDCPLERGEESCHCVSCAKYIGFGGLGKSEGKYNYTNDFGGELESKVGYDYALKLMEEVDHVLCRFGGHQVGMYSTENPSLVQKAKKAGFEVLSTKVRHLGTRLSESVLQQMFVALNSRMDFKFDTEVALIRKGTDGFELDISGEPPIYSKKVIIATGRSGNDWLSDQCVSLGIPQNHTRVDLGIRVEMPANQLDPILQGSFETKLQYRGVGFHATTYCMNPKGRIIRKFQDGLVMADGQNYREQDEGSSNLNFTLFVPRYFSTLQEANQYAHSIIGAINHNRDRILVQRLGDLKNDRATFASTMSRNTVKPTLSVDYGSLKQEVPELYIQAVVLFLESLERLLEKPIDEDTLLYAIDGKFYSPRIETDTHFETEVRDLYVIGDCSGITHSLSQAAASGIYVGRKLIQYQE
ncbi:NAD(P)/FAD-dependent oxidoreductase [Paenibacillus sp. FSL H7-0331]|uniref:NAD(P)/FAD-dependent oxidoreductase n=1 Tax=Paenibacillus sp. FSL H7-0331 TaxID=1920421 RepID=UPI00096D0447|nr:NAD(FAD)-utilizing dehydrogenase [Paenibacillus sp. FSL H7-0331]OMF11640.1 NAD(FAD)-utilizing dehydrogenase [Paenibacillus sp. FSL H7-0331]